MLACNHVEIIVRQFASLFIDLTLCLLPIAFDPVPIHRQPPLIDDEATRVDIDRSIGGCDTLVTTATKLMTIDWFARWPSSRSLWHIVAYKVVLIFDSVAAVAGDFAFGALFSISLVR